MSGESIDLVRSLYEAFARGDVPAVLAKFDPDVEWHEAEGMPYGGVHRGPDAIVQNVFGPVTQDVADFSVTPDEFFESGDEVVTIGRYRGRASESGTELDLPFAHAWTVRGGKILRMRQFVDTAKFNEVLAGQPA
jgi:hypothetical protein